MSVFFHEPKFLFWILPGGRKLNQVHRCLLNCWSLQYFFYSLWGYSQIPWDSVLMTYKLLSSLPFWDRVSTSQQPPDWDSLARFWSHHWPLNSSSLVLPNHRLLCSSCPSRVRPWGKSLMMHLILDPSWILILSPPGLFFLGSDKFPLLHLQQQLSYCCFILIRKDNGHSILYRVKPHILISSLDFRNFSNIIAQSLQETQFHHQSLLKWFKLFQSKREVVCKIRTSFWYIYHAKENPELHAKWSHLKNGKYEIL